MPKAKLGTGLEILNCARLPAGLSLPRRVYKWNFNAVRQARSTRARLRRKAPFSRSGMAGRLLDRTGRCDPTRRNMTDRSKQNGTPGRRARLRTATFDDYQQISDLEARHGMGQVTQAEWMHLWTANPLYRELQKDWDIGWVVEDENGSVVGSLGNVPLPYECGGKRIVAASGRALVTEPAYRSASLLLLDKLIHQPGVDLYLNNTVSSAAAPSFAGFECQRVPVGVWDRAAFWITNRQSFFEQFLYSRAPAFARMLSYPISALDFLHDKLRGESWRARGVEVTICARFDERFDRFWESLRERKREFLLAARNRAALEWHFWRGLLSRQIWIGAVMEGARMAAYGVFERKDNPTFGLSRMRLVDFQTVDNQAQPELLSSVLSWALARCEEERIDMLEIMGRWLERGELVAKLAPHQRRLPNWTYFYRANNAELAARLETRSCWDPTLFDGDASL